MAHHLNAADVSRLSAQCAEILRRLAQGPATNRELATVALKYTSRVSDLREAGWDIACDRLDGGLTRYQLLGRLKPQLDLFGAA